MAERWTPDSWRKKPIVQVPEYPDARAFADVESNLRNFPPLVFVKEVRDLKAKLAAYPGVFDVAYTYAWFVTFAIAFGLYLLLMPRERPEIA